MSTTALIGLLAETSIHAGAGQSGGVIDLPIQREAHTAWPVIYGSAVKGALRALAEERQAPWLKVVFGPETTNASDHAGALLVGDARLLLLPVRSLTGHFKWVTCPALLQRFTADAARLGLDGLDSATIPKVPNHQTVLLPEPTGDALYLEEFRLRTQPADFTAIIPVLARLMGRPDAETALRKQLAWSTTTASTIWPSSPHRSMRISASTTAPRRSNPERSGMKKACRPTRCSM